VTNRKRYSAEFKARVALDASREDLTTTELAKNYNIRPTMISGWSEEEWKTALGADFPTNTAIWNMCSAFGNPPAHRRSPRERWGNCMPRSASWW
jgi:transposase